MLSIQSAFNAYLLGDLSPWDLQDVVERHGFEGWSCESTKRLRLFVNGSTAAVMFND